MNRRVIAAALGILLALGGTPAWAQTVRKPQKPKGPPRWTLEVHGGISKPASPDMGTAGQFPAGATLPTEAGPSRVVPSWFFGDGAALFNEVRSQFASRFNVQYPQIDTLDRTLTTVPVKRQGGATFGFRVGRQSVSRFGVEFGFDRSEGTLKLADAARTAVEAARASFESGFSGLLATVPQTNLSVTSTADIEETGTTQTAMTGALTVRVFSSGRLSVHALAGGGRLTHSSDRVEVRLRGNYQFRLFNTYAFSETDSVTIRTRERKNSGVGLLGGGLTYDFNRRSGLRFDVRALIGADGIRTTVDASPTTSTSVPAIALPSLTTPSIQFSTLATVPSSLSGQTTDLQTLRGNWLDSRVLLSAGLFLRF